MRFAFILLATASSLFGVDTITVAAAANLSQVLPVLGQAFESATKIHVSFSFGSTAQLTQQIQNGAPFDVFASADTDHIDQLISSGLLKKESRIVYATGVLALWFPTGNFLLDDLNRPLIRTIAIAKPELAPYGQAAAETLRSLRVWDAVQPKIVYAGNIGMARQYGASGNADAVFTAYSLVLKDRGRVIQIDESLHRPIAQAAGIVTASKSPKAAEAFLHFLTGQQGRQILKTYGYR